MKKEAIMAPSKAPKTIAVTLRLPVELVNDIKILAKKNNVKPSAVHQIALTRIVKSGI